MSIVEGRNALSNVQDIVVKRMKNKKYKKATREIFNQIWHLAQQGIEALEPRGVCPKCAQNKEISEHDRVNAGRIADHKILLERAFRPGRY